MQPFLLLKQTLEQESGVGPLSLEGAHVHFNRLEQLFWHDGSEAADQIRIGYTTSRLEGLRTCVEVFQETSGGLDVSALEIGRDSHSYSLRRGGVDFADLLGVHPKGRAAKTSKPSVLWDEETTFIDGYRRRVTALNDASTRIALTGDFTSGPFAELVMYLLPSVGMRLPPVIFSRPFDVLEFWVSRLIHVPGDRGTGSRYHRWSPIGNRISSGLFQDHYASALWDLNRQKSDQVGKLQEYMYKMGLGTRIQTKKINDVDMEVLVSRTMTGGLSAGEDMVNIADTGLGVGYALPWLVALVLADHQPVYIEEPEAHLHPEAQYRSAEVLADAAHRGNTVIVETHSDILLLGLQKLVAEGKLKPEDISLNWFQRDESGATHVSKADVTPAGQFGDWPGDLSFILMKAQGDYLDASIERQSQETGND
jgi:hypothetical protein